jgi:hypothetical protein
MAKIFGLGLSKTGTKSLGACLASLGFNHLSWTEELAQDWYDGRIERVFDAVERHDSFDDMPFSVMFREFAELYPDAKFVLTVRSTPEKWLRSFSKHALRVKRNSNFRRKAYGVGYPQNDPEGYIAYYERHNREVQSLLGDRVKVLCWEAGDGWKELCEFLGVAEPDLPFPWENSATDVRPIRYLRHRLAALAERSAMASKRRAS